MSNIKGGVSFNATGSTGVTGVGFQPNDIDFEVGGKSTTGAFVQYCSGSVDENLNQQCRTFFDDQTIAPKYENSTTRCVIVYEKISSAWVKVLELEFISFDVDGFTVDVKVAGASATNYSVIAKCRIV